MRYPFLHMLEDLTNGYDVPLSPKELREQAARQYYTIGNGQQKFEQGKEYLCALPYREFLKTEYWRSVKLAVYRIRGRACGKCGKNRGTIDVHHKSYAHHGEELTHLDDLILLCRKCHGLAHSEALCMLCLCPRGKGLILSEGGKIQPCPKCSISEVSCST